MEIEFGQSGVYVSNFHYLESHTSSVYDTAYDRAQWLEFLAGAHSRVANRRVERIKNDDGSQAASPRSAELGNLSSFGSLDSIAHPTGHVRIVSNPSLGS